MYLILCTNIFCADYRMQGTVFDQVLGSVRASRIRLAVPEVVIDEVVHKYTEEIEAAIKAGSEASTKVLRLAAIEVKDFPTLSDIDRMGSAYRAYLLDRLAAAGAVLLAYPAVSHQQAALRDATGKKPFVAGGHGKGYRDYLIWQTVLEAAQTDEVLFVTNNPRDFCDGSGEALHPDLLSDLAASGLAATRVLVVRSLKDALGDYIEPQLALATPPAEEAVKSEFLAAADADEFAMFLTEHLRGQALSTVLQDVPDAIVNFGTVLEVGSLSFSDVLPLGEDEFLLTLELDAEMELDAYIPKWAWYGGDLEHRGLHASDLNWNEQYVYASATRAVRLGVNVTYHRPSAALRAVELASVEDADLVREIE
jgi:predicted nucleic acid-binding protein